MRTDVNRVAVATRACNREIDAQSFRAILTLHGG
jgi:hypothetical protein